MNVKRIFRSMLNILLSFIFLSGMAFLPASIPSASVKARTGPAKADPFTTIYLPVIEKNNNNLNVRINWWHTNTTEPGRSYWQTLANEYMALHPNVTIQIIVMDNEIFKTNLANAMAADNPPDIFPGWGSGVMLDHINAGMVKDITTDLDANGSAWRNTFSQGALDVYAHQGRYYGVPWDVGMVGFWYNKSLFATAGITAEPATWTEFLADIGALKAHGITPIAIGEGDKWTGAFYWEYLVTRIGGKAAFEAATNGTGSFTDPPFVQAGYALNDLIDLQPFQTNFLSATWGDESNLMGNGQAAMDLMGQWAPGSFGLSSTEVGFFPFPAVEGGAGAATDIMGGDNGFEIGKNAPPETVDFLKYLTRVESQVQCAQMDLCIPVVVGGEAGMTDPLMIELHNTMVQANYQQLFYDQFLPQEVGQAVNNSIQGIFAETLTPEQCAQAIEDSADLHMIR